METKIKKTREGTIFSIDDLVDTTPKCEEDKFLKGIVTKKVDGVSINYCVKNQIIGDVCPYLRVKDGYRQCFVYDK